jgi:hypothetical protein
MKLSTSIQKELNMQSTMREKIKIYRGIEVIGVEVN